MPPLIEIDFMDKANSDLIAFTPLYKCGWPSVDQSPFLLGSQSASRSHQARLDTRD